MEYGKEIEIRWRDLDAYGHVNHAVRSRPLDDAERAAFERAHAIG